MYEDGVVVDNCVEIVDNNNDEEEEEEEEDNDEDDNNSETYEELREKRNERRIDALISGFVNFE